MIEKQMSDFLFGEIQTSLNDVPEESSRRIKRYLAQLKTVMDASLESSDNGGSSRRGKKG